MNNRFKFRLIEKEDIEFIFFLRSISKAGVLKNIDRLQNRIFTSEFINDKQTGYYAFETEERVIGYYRFYAIKNRIEIGSWITNPEATTKEKILFDIEFKNKVFNLTGSKQLYFDVRKHNTSVWKHHERFGAELIYEDEKNKYYFLKVTTFKPIYNAKIDRLN